jgi:two-component system chemotaxis sensor kinase CheA
MAGKEDAYVELFLAEARDHLEAVERDFLVLESVAGATGGLADQELLNRIFRAMHTIKGGAGMVGLVPIKSLAHAMENILSRMREGSQSIEPTIVSALLEGVDLLRFALDNGGGGENFDPSPLLARLESAPPSAALPASPSNVSESPPSEDDMAWFAQFQKDGMVVLPDPVEAPVPTVAAQVVPIRETPVVEASAPKAVAPSPARQTETLRVRVELLDQLMSLAGELVLVRNQHMLAVSREDTAGRKLATRLNQVTSELQETVMRTRMQPMSLVYGKLGRLVRDLGRSLNKQMQLETRGEEVELDKTILEALTDPLMHLVRNSCDHGVETPDQRTATGKKPLGTVFVRAQHEGGQMHIEVGDDGKGIDPESIRKSALKKGLKTAEELSKMSSQEILNLIFLPGFSTAQKVTDVSGRGVGMDVVQNGISQLGGIIEIESHPGQGATFHLRLPLTLAIIPSLIIKTDNERFAIPQVNLEELVRLYGDEGRDKIEVAANTEVYRLRERLLPIVRLREVLRRAEPFNDQVKASIAVNARQNAENHTLNILVLKCGSSRFGLVVDEIVRNEDIVVTPMHSALKKLEIFSGTTIMGDGQVSLIFDVHGLARHAGVDLQVSTTRARAATTQYRPGWRTESLLLFKAGPKEQFGLPLTAIKRVEHLPVSRLESVGGQLFVTLDHVSTRVIELDKHLKISPTRLDETAFLILPRDVSSPVAILASNLVDVGSYDFHIEQDLLTGKGFLGRAVIGERLTLFPDIEGILEGANIDVVRADMIEWKEASGDA